MANALLLEDLDPDPVSQFRAWYEQVRAAGYWEPNAMVLSTVEPDGTPSARYVLLRGFDDGFVFYTSYESPKARALGVHPVAALTFGWIEARWQVRVVGPVAPITAAESDAYFAARPRGSQISACVSAQSEPIASRDVLEREHARLSAQYEGGDVPRPPGWGGYRVTPTSFEFWQGRPERLHDRFRYEVDGEGWRIERLSP